MGFRAALPSLWRLRVALGPGLPCGPSDGCNGKSGRLVASIVFFAMSLACKAATVGLPLVLAILDVYPLKRLSTGRLFSRISAQVAIEKTPFVVLALRQFWLPFTLGSSLARWRRCLTAVWLHALLKRVISALFYPAKSLIPFGTHGLLSAA